MCVILRESERPLSDASQESLQTSNKFSVDIVDSKTGGLQDNSSLLSLLVITGKYIEEVETKLETRKVHTFRSYVLST